MTQSIKPISLTKLRSVIANHNGASITKLNQFAMQHIAESFGKNHLVVAEYGPEQPQLYSTSLILNTEKIVGVYGLNRMQRELVLEFLRKLYTCVHVNFVCSDFVEHWENEGLEIEKYRDTEIKKTHDLLIQHDSNAQAMHNFRDSAMGITPSTTDAVGELFGKLFGTNSPLSDIFGGMTLSPLNTAIGKEVDYLTENPSVTIKQCLKLTKHLNNHKLKKYAKLMAKYGHEMQNFKLEDGDVVPVVSEVVEEKKDVYTEILSFKPNATNNIEEQFMQDAHYTQYGIKYEAPLSFDKIMIRLMNQYANGLVTPAEVTSELKPLLIKILGDKLATKVEVVETPDGFAIGVNTNGMSETDIKSKIDHAIHNTIILN